MMNADWLLNPSFSLRPGIVLKILRRKREENPQPNFISNIGKGTSLVRKMKLTGMLIRREIV